MELLQVLAELTDKVSPIKWDAITGVDVGVGVVVGVVVVVVVFVGVMVGVGVVVGVFVGVFVGVVVSVGVILGVGVGVIGIICPISQFCVSVILITIFSISYGAGTLNVYGKVETVETYTQLALIESQ